MSRNSLSKRLHTLHFNKWLLMVLLPAYVYGIFLLSGQIVGGVFQILLLTPLKASLSSVNMAILDTVVSIAVYALALLLVIGLPWWLARRRTTIKQLGLQRLPTWLDIGIVLPAYVIYLALTAFLGFIASHISWIDINQTQQTGFSHLSSPLAYGVAFLTLVVVAPIAEELLFRGYLFGKLKQRLPIWLAILVVSLTFAIAHQQWNVGIDVFALSIVLCTIRQLSGSLWSSAMLHMVKNAIAFYVLFIIPALSGGIGS